MLADVWTFFYAVSLSNALYCSRQVKVKLRVIGSGWRGHPLFPLSPTVNHIFCLTRNSSHVHSTPSCAGGRRGQWSSRRQNENFKWIYLVLRVSRRTVAELHNSQSIKHGDSSEEHNYWAPTPQKEVTSLGRWPHSNYRIATVALCVATLGQPSVRNVVQYCHTGLQISSLDRFKRRVCWRPADCSYYAALQYKQNCFFIFFIYNSINCCTILIF